MILFHIIDDFVLQPICLSKLKQKTFWEPYVKNNSLYKNDYKVALAIHGLSWAIMIHIPLMVYGVNEIGLFISVILNSIIHAYIDDKKANKLNISLRQYVRIDNEEDLPRRDILNKLIELFELSDDEIVEIALKVASGEYKYEDLLDYINRHLN